MAGDLLTAERACGFVPGTDPVDGSGHGEGGEHRVAGSDGFVRNSLFNVSADGCVDPTFEGANLLASFGGEFALVEHGDAAAELVKNNGFRVGLDICADLFEAGAAADDGFVEELLDESDARVIALDEDLFFVSEVVVERGFGDLKTLGEIAHGGAAIAFFEKHMGGGLEDSVALDVLIALAGLKGLPWFVIAPCRIFHVTDCLRCCGWGKGFSLLDFEADEAHEFDAVTFGDDAFLELVVELHFSIFYVVLEVGVAGVALVADVGEG